MWEELIYKVNSRKSTNLTNLTKFSIFQRVYQIEKKTISMIELYVKF